MINNQKIEKETETISHAISTFEINSIDDLKTSVVLISELKSKFSEVKSAKDEMSRSASETLKKISSFFENPLTAIKNAEINLKEKIQKYIDKNENERNVILETMSDLTQEERPLALQKASELDLPKINGLSIRETWEGTVENPDKLLDWIISNKKLEFLSINQKALSQYTQQLKADPEIPGWISFKKKTIVISKPKDQ